jgi:hypothetical protein
MLAPSHCCSQFSSSSIAITTFIATSADTMRFVFAAVAEEGEAAAETAAPQQPSLLDQLSSTP